MAKEQSIFLRRVARSWASEFPFLSGVDLQEIPRVPKGCNFVCDAYGITRQRYYFISFDFSPKCRGQFTVRVTASESRERSILGQVTKTDPSPSAIGMFPIARFVNRPRLAWQLVDIQGERNALFARLGGEEDQVTPSRSKNVWHPSTYNQPIEKTSDEAIASINDILRRNVFPVLEIGF